MKKLNTYKNGNAKVIIWDDGTRETEWPDNEEINLDFPLNIDLCVGLQCPYQCPWCYNNSVPNGKQGNIMNLKFIETLTAGTEISLGGGSATTHPDLIPFLEKLKSLGVIANLTVSQWELVDKMELINDLIDKELIHGLGVSYKEPQDLIYKNMEQPNMVVHLIAGIHTKETFDYLSQFNLKILILGYKDIGRGFYYKDATEKIINKNIEWLKENIKNYFGKFKVISFDGLALEQLDVKNLISNDDWNKYYQLEEGKTSCYINAVDNTVHLNSLTEVSLLLKDNINDIFKDVKEKLNTH
jgi:organic radical activating enzyme